MGKTDENRANEACYALRDEDGQTIYLHREILGIPRDDEQTVVEHLNGDTLDCRRQNLKIVTPA